jgi:hypothetical protein
MGRFDREEQREGQSGGLPPALGTATQDLRATVEEKLREIVEAAEARAHEIEDRALEQALEIEQEAEQKAGRRFESSADRAQQMIAAVDAFEREVREALRTLRAKGEELAIELGAPPPSSPDGGTAVADAPPESPEAAAPTEPDEAEAVPAESAASEASGADLVREDVRKQILDLFMAGKPRAEAERMLGRIEDGSRYSDLLDEVYEGRSETQQGSSSRRRGGRRRRRPGSPQ